MNPKDNSNNKSKNANEGKSKKHLDSISRLIEAAKGCFSPLSAV
jgi:hypothetical protein